MSILKRFTKSNVSFPETPNTSSLPPRDTAKMDNGRNSKEVKEDATGIARSVKFMSVPSLLKGNYTSGSIVGKMDLQNYFVVQNSSYFKKIDQRLIDD